MRKIFWLLVFVCGSANAADDYIWAKQEMPVLKAAYKKYLSASPALRRKMEPSLAELKPTVERFKIQGLKEERRIPAFQFFTLVDPITGESKASAAEKLAKAAQDLGMLDAFMVVTELLEQNPNVPNQNFLQFTQEVMMSWALEAADPKTSSLDRKVLSSAFAYMVSEIGQRPELLQLAPAYRTRRAFLLETPEIAQEEAERIRLLLEKLPKN